MVGVVAVWLRFAPPRRAASRHLVALLMLGAGLLLPLVPGWTVPGR